MIYRITARVDLITEAPDKRTADLLAIDALKELTGPGAPFSKFTIETSVPVMIMESEKPQWAAWEKITD